MVAVADVVQVLVGLVQPEVVAMACGARVAEAPPQAAPPAAR